MSKKVHNHKHETNLSQLADAVGASQELQEPIKPGFAKGLLSDWSGVDWVETDRKFNCLFNADSSESVANESASRLN